MVCLRTLRCARSRQVFRTLIITTLTQPEDNQQVMRDVTRVLLASGLFAQSG